MGGHRNAAHRGDARIAWQGGARGLLGGGRRRQLDPDSLSMHVYMDVLRAPVGVVVGASGMVSASVGMFAVVVVRVRGLGGTMTVMAGDDVARMMMKVPR